MKLWFDPQISGIDHSRGQVEWTRGLFGLGVPGWHPFLGLGKVQLMSVGRPPMRLAWNSRTDLVRSETNYENKGRTTGRMLDRRAEV